MMVDNFDEYEGGSVCIIESSSNDCVFESLLVQTMDRFDERFIAIRNVRLKPRFKGIGLFKDFVVNFEKLNLNIMFYDIVNQSLFNWLENNGYVHASEQRYGTTVDYMYKLKEGE